MSGTSDEEEDKGHVCVSQALSRFGGRDQEEGDEITTTLLMPSSPARQKAARAGVADRCTFIQGDVMTLAADSPARYDFV